jgi:hypothetical protein
MTWRIALLAVTITTAIAATLWWLADHNALIQL